jgi:hypothetical protein
VRPRKRSKMLRSLNLSANKSSFPIGAGLMQANSFNCKELFVAPHVSWRSCRRRFENVQRASHLLASK